MAQGIELNETMGASWLPIKYLQRMIVWEQMCFPREVVFILMVVNIQGVTGGKDQTSGGCSLC